MAGQSNSIAVLGAGSWGATLTWLLAKNGLNVKLWTQNAEKARLINEEHGLSSPIAVKIPENAFVTSDLDACLLSTEMIIFCCTSQSMRSLAEKVKSHLSKLPSKPILISAVKGLELNSLKRMTEVINEILPKYPVCALSGPNLAGEILLGLPTASVIACKSSQTARTAQQCLSVPKFRLYSSDDVIGVELGGTLKNVIAIAAGISDGLKLGENAKAALLTRGLAEMTRISMDLGANALTLSGLSGVGDLLATSAGLSSRNYRLGHKLAQGQSLSEALQDLGVVVEGVTTTQAICELSKRLSIELPIAEQVELTLKGKTTPQSAIMTLMGRPLSSEW